MKKEMSWAFLFLFIKKETLEKIVEY